MNYSLVQYSPPAAEPITLVEAKLHLRVDITDDDTYISSLIAAARGYCENYTSRQFVTATYDFRLDNFPQNMGDEFSGKILSSEDLIIRLPKAPLQSVSYIKYIDLDGNEQTLGASYYIVDEKSEPARIALAYNQVWPDTREIINAVTIRFVCGYGAYTTVPESIKSAMKLLIGHWYENREEIITGTIVSKIPRAVDSLLWMNRVLEAA